MELILMFVTFFILLIIGLPVAFAMLTSSIVYILSQDILAGIFIAQRMISSLNSFTLLAIPFFITAGTLMNELDVSKRIFHFAEMLVGHVRGGLAHVNVLASLIFAGMSGSSAADVGGLGTLEIEAMNRLDYPRPFSAAVTAASSAIGPIVPPSVMLVLFGVMTQTSVGKLFISGFIPGILMTISLMFIIAINVSRRKFPKGEAFSFSNLVKSFFKGFFALLTPLILLAFLILGIVTPAELGVILIFYSIFVGLIYKKLSWGKLIKAMKDSAVLTTQVLFLIAAASIFGNILIRENIPTLLLNVIDLFNLNQISFLILLSVVLLILGCFIEGIAIEVLMIPVIVPIALELGIDMVHLGLVMVLAIEIGLITPPLGIGVYIASDIAKVSVADTFLESVKFIIPLVIVLIITIVFPDVVLYLPRLFF